MCERAHLLVTFLLMSACLDRVVEPLPSTSSAEQDAGVTADAGRDDGGFFDAGAADGGAPDGGAADGGASDGGASDGGNASACGPVTLRTKCKSGGNSAIVRGIAKFPSFSFDAGAPLPALAVFMRHELVMDAFEATIGGRLHAHRYIKLTQDQVRKGEAPFQIDLCTFDTAMWSEENGNFNVVVMLDEKGIHKYSTTDEYPFQTPQVGEWVKMVQNVNVSCHAESACVEMTLDCNLGTACTTFTPLQSVQCRTPSCRSDHSICSP